MFSKCTNKLQARWWILMYVLCFFLLLSSITTCKLVNMCLVSLRPQSPLPKVFALTLVVMVVLFHHSLHPRLIPVSSTYASDHYHKWVWIQCLNKEDFSCEPWFLYKMNFMSDNCIALCDKHWMIGVLVKILRNLHSLLHVKFLVVNLFVSRPSHKPFPRTLEKISGERSLILRLKGPNYNILTSLSWRKLFLFCTAWKRFVIIALHMTLSIMFYLSNCNLLYQSILITIQDIQNYPNCCNRWWTPKRKFWSPDTTSYLNPKLLKFECHSCVLYNVTFSLFM